MNSGTVTYLMADTADAVAIAAAQAQAAPSNFPTILVTTIAILTILSFIMIYRHVSSASHWSLSDALSEDVELTVRDETDKAVIDAATKKPMAETVMRASSSRLIALVGSIAILMLYVGAGLAVLKSFATTGKLPDDTEKLAGYFLSGMVLFAPYVVNKFSSVFGATK